MVKDDPAVGMASTSRPRARPRCPNRQGSIRDREGTHTRDMGPLGLVGRDGEGGIVDPRQGKTRAKAGPWKSDVTAARGRWQVPGKKARR